jgi:methylated-DNA-[protein]-cysteine S-methyltransferase
MPDEVCVTMTTPLGALRLLARHERLVGVVFLAGAAGVQPGSRSVPAVSDGSASPVLRQASRELAEYFAGERRAFEVPLDLSGWPPFTRKILEELCKVPYGETLTYGELAARAGSPRAARAVGQAMAANPLPIIIPCHRVVAADGRLGGYSGGDGLPTKQWLLTFEQSNRRRP